MTLNNIYVLLNFLAAINILLFCFFLWFQKANTLPNILLSIILLIPGLYFVDNIIVITKTINSIPYFFFFVQFIANLFPICIYYYIHLLLGDKKKFNPILLAGSIACIIYSLGLFVSFLLLSGGEKSTFLGNLNSSEYPLSMDIYNYLFYILQLLYFIKLYREIKAYRHRIEDHLSDINLVKVLFVRQFVNLLFMLNVSLVLFYIFLPMPLVDYGVLPVITVIIYCFIIFFSIKNNVILTKDAYVKLNQINEHVDLNSSVKPEDVTIPDEQLELIAVKISKVLCEQKCYQISDLTLIKFSEILDEKAYIISCVINDKFQKNFNELINEYRIKEAISLLKSFDSKTEKIDTIALASGFNSRATFYRCFKKITGKNPTDFITN